MFPHCMVNVWIAGACWRVTTGKTPGYPGVIKCKKITEGAKSWGEVMCMKA